MTELSSALQALGIPVENHLLPFYWQQGNHYEKIVSQIGAIQASGAQAFCVESRTHADFCGLDWWRDMDLMLAEASRRNMKVWILDDKHFPTGYANGAIEKYHPELRAWQFIERHLDVIGPQKNAALLLDRDTEETSLLAAYAYPRTQHDETLADSPVELTAHVQGQYLRWDIPDGLWRVFFVSKSRNGHNPSRKFYIDMMRSESVKVLLDAVYEPHYEHYAKYFGNTLAGFFSDEPGIGNLWFNQRDVSRFHPDYGFYETRVGIPGFGMPYGEELAVQLQERWGEQWLSRIPALWYTLGDDTPRIRQDYMDAVTARYRDCFVRQVGDWCRARNVCYIGHIIEDMGAHAHLGCSAGHYFRAEDGQDMAGMDIVLHQIIPGMGRHIHTASGSGNAYDGLFFEYMLPKMCASASHISPRHHGQAMCEIFGAFGWAEGLPYMKWLMDYLLVSGINQFVPHAFSPCFPNGDCPPHFGAEGHDPQFPAFGKLMLYTNQAASILNGLTHVAPVALLYHAEAEWGAVDPEDFMPTQLPAAKLTDEHLDFDIIPIDTLNTAGIIDGRLAINGENFQCLVIPGAKYFPPEFLATLKRFREAGLPLFFVGQLPSDCPFEAQPLPLEELTSRIRQAGIGDFQLAGQGPLADLRHYHVRKDGREVFFFVNFSTSQAIAAECFLPCNGPCWELDLAHQECYGGEAADGCLQLSLAPGESRFFVFDKMLPLLPKRPQHGPWRELSPEYSIDIASSDNLQDFHSFRDKSSVLPDLFSELPDFSGFLRYSFDIVAPEDGVYLLDLGEVGQTAQLSLNGKDCGCRYCRPYQFQLCLQAGHNQASLTIANTLVNAVKDPFSFFLQIPPSGLIGPLRIAGIY